MTFTNKELKIIELALLELKFQANKDEKLGIKNNEYNKEEIYQLLIKIYKEEIKNDK